MTNDRNALRHKMTIIDKEIEDAKKEIIEHKRTTEEVLKEKNNLAKMVVKTQAVNKEQGRLIKIQQKSKEKLEQELDMFFMENNKQKKEIASLQKEKDRCAESQIELTKKIEDLVEEVRQKKVKLISNDFKVFIINHLRCTFLN